METWIHGFQLVEWMSAISLAKMWTAVWKQPWRGGANWRLHIMATVKVGTAAEGFGTVKNGETKSQYIINCRAGKVNQTETRAATVEKAIQGGKWGGEDLVWQHYVSCLKTSSWLSETSMSEVTNQRENLASEKERDNHLHNNYSAPRGEVPG